MAIDNKLRQVTDTIHGTIFLSSLESAMIATPYFFRLHDIYQSSTVYMTYPTNRTKRYEHSLGVMQLVSKMLFSSVANADDPTRGIFFDALDIRFQDVVKNALYKSNDMNVGGGYYQNLKSFINMAFNRHGYDDIWDCISNARLTIDGDSIFFELALDQHQYYPMIVDNASEDMKQFFLYRCLLQAIRIVALFHDVGHPPFSHIIESAMKAIFLEADKVKWDAERKVSFDNSLKKFVVDGSDAFKCNTIYVDKSLEKAETHERIGFSLLQYAFDEAIKSLNLKPNDNDQMRATLMYIVSVAEFSMAIWAEKDDFFVAIHKLVDGIIDADRLDYIMRDSKNSGVNWGEIPYDRIITPMKLMLVDNRFIFAFPNKLEEDIIDILLIRYKLFARVNYHHRCMKTAKALQTAVKLIAENYLSSDESDINEDISVLWKALSPEAGDKLLRVIQWNDSFLISTLHKSLVALQNGEGVDASNKRIIQDNLEEILLNKRKYFSIIKRGQDCKRFSDLLLKKAGLTAEKIEAYIQIEFCRLCKSEGGINPAFGDSAITRVHAANECDSVKRGRSLLDLMATGDLEMFDAVGLSDAYTLMSTELDKMMLENIISDYHLIKNEGRTKRGLPRHRDVFDEIYLYDASNQVHPLDDKVSLEPQIKMIEKTIPWIYVYVAPGKKRVSDIVKVVFERLAQALANEISSHEKMLFAASEKGEC